MNINDDLTQVLKKINELSEQVFHRNEEEDEVKHTLEIRAREARDREIAEKFQDEEWEISKLEQLKQVEINRQNDDGGWHFDELKKIEKESKNRKSELRRLRAAARELQEANRLMKGEEEIAQLLEKTSLEEELELPASVRSSKAKRNASRSPKKRLVPVDYKDDEEDALQYLRSSRPRTSRRKLSLASASLPEGDFMSMRSAKARMAPRNLSRTSLHVQETKDDCTEDEDSEDDCASLSPRKGRKAKRKPQNSSGNVDDLMSQFLGFMPVGLGSGSNLARSGSPGYIGGVHPNPYIPTYGGSISPPIVGPYGYGLPGLIVNSGVGNIVNCQFKCQQ